MIFKFINSLKYPNIKAYASVKKNNAAREARMTAGSAAIINKYNAIGKPANVPKISAKWRFVDENNTRLTMIVIVTVAGRQV